MLEVDSLSKLEGLWVVWSPSYVVDGWSPELANMRCILIPCTKF